MLGRLWAAESRVLTIPKLLNSIAPRCAAAGESSLSLPRRFSSDEKSPSPPAGQVFRHERHNMYVCWHPEVPFPYEMTKPIDLNAPIAQSNLKIQALTPVKEAFRKKHEKLMIQELVKLTYATKHKFYGRYGMSKRRYLKSIDPNKQKHNREYL